MGKSEPLNAQQWLPGFEPTVDPDGGRPRLPPRRSRTARPRPPSIEKLVATSPTRVRKLFATLRTAILAPEHKLAEQVAFDDLSGSFAPAYRLGHQEVLRLHLDPVLAATLTLERGDRQLGALMASPHLAAKLKSATLRSARRSGRRIFVALLVRNADEMAALVSLVRERMALENQPPMRA